MTTNLAIDNALIEEARDIGGKRTKRAAVEEALREYIQHRKQLKILDLFGTIDYDPAYDYKKQRRVDGGESRTPDRTLLTRRRSALPTPCRISPAPPS